MSDRGKLPFDFDAVDWDAALDEWDRGDFEPEVARDRSREEAPAAAPVAEVPAGGEGHDALTPLRAVDDASSAPVKELAAPRPPRPAATLATADRPPRPAAPRVEATRSPSSPPGDADEPGPTKTRALSESMAAELQSVAASGEEAPPRGEEPAPETARRQAGASDRPTFPGHAEDDGLDSLGHDDPTMAYGRNESGELVELGADSVPPDVPRLDDDEVLEPTAVRTPRPNAPDATRSPPPKYEAALGVVPATPREIAPSWEDFRDSEAHVVAEALTAASPRAPIVEPAAAPSPSDSAPPARRPSPPTEKGPRAWSDERPASQWLDGALRTALEDSALWLAEESRLASSASDVAHGLFVASELRALLGAREAASSLADEAASLDPTRLLALRQARHLDASGPDAPLHRLDQEIASQAPVSARVHACLMAADVARLAGRGDTAVAHWERARLLDPTDPRAPTALAALAIGQGQLHSSLLEASGEAALAPVDEAIAEALRLRGVGAGDATPTFNDVIREARSALAAGDLATATDLVARLRRDGALRAPATWLALTLGALTAARREQAAAWLLELVSAGVDEARRPLVARALELRDDALVRRALAAPGEFTLIERAVIERLAQQVDVELEVAVATDASSAALGAALLATSLASDGERVREELARSIEGDDSSRASFELGRLTGSGAPAERLEAAMIAAARHESGADAREPVAIHLASLASRGSELAEAIRRLPTEGDPLAEASQRLAMALLIERTDEGRAREAYRGARGAWPAHEAALRALADIDDTLNLPRELSALADALPEAPRRAHLLLEALARASALDDATREAWTRRAHDADPSAGIAAHLGERNARARGDVDSVLHWIGERRAFVSDGIESALDDVRVALLTADRDTRGATDRLAAAHAARPADVALRELYERLAPDPVGDAGAWRVERAKTATGLARRALGTEAIVELERTGELEAALDAFRAFPSTLGELAAERILDARGGDPAELARLEAHASDDGVLALQALFRLALLHERGGRADEALDCHRRALALDAHFLPSLRRCEHAAIASGDVAARATVSTQVALALATANDGELSAHAAMAARLRARELGWEAGRLPAELAFRMTPPPIWAARLHGAHARLSKDDGALLASSEYLLGQTPRAAEQTYLHLRAAEALLRLDRVEESRTHAEYAVALDPADVVAWGLLADLRERLGDRTGAAEACESLARSSRVPEHQVVAWYDAARLWTDELDAVDRGTSALEHAAAVDVLYEDVYERLASLYRRAGREADVAALIERRLETCGDPTERVALEVERARSLSALGQSERARRALAGALSVAPDHVAALHAYADLCAQAEDWAGAEESLVRLTRVVATPREQREVYERLGDLYATHHLNLARAEVAFREVLKREPKNEAALTRLVDVYARKGDGPRAVEAQTQLVTLAPDAPTRLARLVELGRIHESVSKDLKRAEQAYEAARREFPTAVGPLKALAQFYERQRELPAMHILLDRAAGDARRSFAAGRFVGTLFDMLAATHELHHRVTEAAVVLRARDAVEGRPAQLPSGAHRALDERLDDVVSGERVPPALRSLLARVGDALDLAYPIDLGAMDAQPVAPDHPLATTVQSFARALGLAPVRVLATPRLGRVAVPCGSSPPVVLVGDELLGDVDAGARAFVILRALKLIVARASALVRAQAQGVASMLAGLFVALNPHYVPEGIAKTAWTEASHRIAPSLPRQVDPTVAVLALEAAGSLGPNLSSVGPSILAWADRAAHLAVADLNAAFDAIAWSLGDPHAPREPEARAAWIARTAEARELVLYAVGDEWLEARRRLGLGA